MLVCCLDVCARFVCDLLRDVVELWFCMCFVIVLFQKAACVCCVCDELCDVVWCVCLFLLCDCVSCLMCPCGL